MALNPRVAYISIILSLSSIGIILMIGVMIIYKTPDTKLHKIRKFIIFQLTVSCILHCISHFLSIPDGDTICQIEGALDYISLLSTLLLTVQISIFSYYSLLESNNLFQKYTMQITKVLSISGWLLPIILCSVCFTEIKPFSPDKDCGNCILNANGKGPIISEICYVIVLICGLGTSFFYTLKMMKYLQANEKIENKCKNIKKILFCSINGITYIPTIIQHIFELTSSSMSIEADIIIDILECLSGFVYVIINEYEHLSFKKSENIMSEPLNELKIEANYLIDKENE